MARKLGWTPLAGCDLWNRGEGYHPSDGIELPDFAGDIEAAWDILGKYLYAIHLHRDAQYPFWECWFLKEDVKEQADTAPLAICLAFLKLP